MGPRVRLAVAALLFVLWIGWLAFLAATTTRPVVLSRPQFLVCNLYVVAELGPSPDGPGHPAIVVKVKEVGWSEADRALLKPGSEITVPNLAEVGPHQGWDQPGDYLLPLTKHLDGTYTVTPVPRSPGYSGAGERVRIYPDTPATRAQLTEIESLRP